MESNDAPPPAPPTHHPKLPHVDPPRLTLPTAPPPHRPSLNPPLQCPPPPGAFGPLLLGGGVASKSEETSPPWPRLILGVDGRTNVKLPDQGHFCAER